MKKKQEHGVFFAQCLVSIALVILGFLIFQEKSAFLQPAKTAFYQVLTKDSGIEQVYTTVETFFESLCN